jgi:hypothetical protein
MVLNDVHSRVHPTGILYRQHSSFEHRHHRSTSWRCAIHKLLPHSRPHHRCPDIVQYTSVAGIGCLLDERENEADGRRCADEMGDDGDIEGRMMSQAICEALENGSDAEATRRPNGVIR